MFKKLAQQLKIQNDKIDCINEKSCIPMSSPMRSIEEETYKAFLKSMSRQALNLYERKSDIKNFTELALSDPENTSHNEIVEDLLKNDAIVDPFDETKYFNLSENERFLKDLGY